MKSAYETVTGAAALIRKKTPAAPRVGLLTGTGLGSVIDAIDVDLAIRTRTIPCFPVSTVQSHEGRLVFGKMGGVEVLVLQGRVHLYEGYLPEQVVFSIRLMRALGVDTLILTNAAGGLDLSFQTGDIMVIRDHINLTGANPLVGPNEDRWGARFPDMVNAYDPALRRMAVVEGEKMGWRLHEGVYAGLRGPSLETPAENRFLRTIGADAVGFSTVLEVIAAVHAGMRVLALSIITNINDPDHPEAATLSAIISSANAAAPKVEAIVRSLVERL